MVCVLIASQIQRKTSWGRYLYEIFIWKTSTENQSSVAAGNKTKLMKCAKWFRWGRWLGASLWPCMTATSKTTKTGCGWSNMRRDCVTTRYIVTSDLFRDWFHCGYFQRNFPNTKRVFPNLKTGSESSVSGAFIQSNVTVPSNPSVGSNHLQSNFALCPITMPLIQTLSAFPHHKEWDYVHRHATATERRPNMYVYPWLTPWNTNTKKTSSFSGSLKRNGLTV